MIRSLGEATPPLRPLHPLRWRLPPPPTRGGKHRRPPRPAPLPEPAFRESGRNLPAAVLFSPGEAVIYPTMSMLLASLVPLITGVGYLPPPAAPAMLTAPLTAPPAQSAPVFEAPAPLTRTAPARLDPVALRLPPPPAANQTPTVTQSYTPLPVIPQVQPLPVQAPSPAPPAAVSPAPTRAPDRAAMVDRISQALAATRTAKGRFTQTDPAGRSSSGDFYISRPGKIRFDYKTPEPVFIVSDGVSVSIEEPKRDAYDAIALSATPLNLFLKSDVDLARSGDVVAVRQEAGSTFVTLEDRTGEAEGQMILEFQGANMDLVGWNAIDGAGGVTAVRLSGIETNVPLKASLFVVRAPEDRDDEDRR